MSKKKLYYIREPQHADKKHWLELWSDYVDEFTPKPEALEVTWERLLDKTQEPYGLFLFSAQSGEFIGFLHYTLHRTTWYEGYDCYIEDICIKTEHRYNGVFAFLYEEFVKKMKAREDCRIIYWRTKVNNYPACAAYDKVAKRTDWVSYEHWLIETNIKVKAQE